MNNITKLLLAPAILATGALASNPTVLDVEKGFESNGTINVAAGMTLKVKQGEWIVNKGVFNFYRANDNDKFTIMGTDSEGADSSGIQNDGATIKQSDGAPAAEDLPVSGNAYYMYKDGDGKMFVINTSTNETTKLAPTDYNKVAGGTITDESTSLYGFLKTNEWTITNNNSNVIVLRGANELSESNNIISLDHTYPGLDPTSAGSPLTIQTPFVNSSKYSTFTKDSVNTSYANDYGLSVKGYYTFMGNNSEFTGKSVEFLDGASKILSIASMFPQDEIKVSGGVLDLDLQTYGQQGQKLNFAKTISVTSNMENENPVYGCLKISASSDFSLAEGGVLNLGIIPTATEEQEGEVNIEP